MPATHHDGHSPLTSPIASDQADRLAAAARDLIRNDRIDEALPHMREACALQPRLGLELAQMLLFLLETDAAVLEAVSWLEGAEREGSPQASYWLALLALGDHAAPRDAERIQSRLASSAEAGVAPAMRALAMMQASVDPLASQALLDRLIERGDPIALQLTCERLREQASDPTASQRLVELQAAMASMGYPQLPQISSSRGAEARDADFASQLRSGARQALHESPAVWTCENLFSAEECRYLIATGLPHLQRSQVFEPGTDQRGALPIRSSDDASFDISMEDFFLRLLQLRMALAADAELRQAEPLILLHYRPGQEYRPHRDYLAPSALEGMRPEAGQRHKTICVYLNTVEAGGATDFSELQQRVEAQTGRAVIFDNLRPDGSPEPASLHAGMPVERGEKWLATLWLRQRHLRRY